MLGLHLAIRICVLTKTAMCSDSPKLLPNFHEFLVFGKYSTDIQSQIQIAKINNKQNQTKQNQRSPKIVPKHRHVVACQRVVMLMEAGDVVHDCLGAVHLLQVDETFRPDAPPAGSLLAFLVE